MRRVVLVVSGLPDLVTALAALDHCGCPLTAVRSELAILLAGQRVSLPVPLVTSFRRVASMAYGLDDVSVHLWEDGEPTAFLQSHAKPELVLANQLQSRMQRTLIAQLSPSAFVFFDNGLSSYADHQIDMTAWMARLPECASYRACLTYLARLGTPGYLAPFLIEALGADSLRMAVEPIRATCVPEAGRLGAGDGVIIGTAFARAGLIAETDERSAHLRLLDAVRPLHGGAIWFKAHPRAGVALLDESDGVRVLDPDLPMEAFVAGAGGAAYSFSSTCLFTLEDQFNWRCLRAAHPAMDSVLSSRPQLAKMAVLQPSLNLSDGA